MAEIVANDLVSRTSGYVVYQWRAVRAGDSCLPAKGVNVGLIAPLGRRTVQISGPFEGAAVEIRGGLVAGDEYPLLRDRHGMPLVFDMEAVRGIADDVALVLPRVVGGNENTELTITLMLT